ncbi:MAG: dihydrofolate reductase [Bacteroidetes bacterium]|jgi:dihydrofolate reductase|nr:dihydrofolate reductase [Bacteroidota bacterium]
MNASVFIATSLDGFIAREDGAIDWLPTPDGTDEDYGYQAFMDTVDVLVMGRHTYETVLSFGAWPYETPVVVLSHRSIEQPEEQDASVERMAGPPREILQRLADRGLTHAYVDGGRTIQRFLADGLIQRLTITVVPVLLGEGLPLFGPLPHDVRLQLLDTRSFPNGLVQHRYAVVAE